MSGIIVVAETRAAGVTDATLKVLAAGLALKDAVGGPLRVMVAAANPAAHTPAVMAGGVDEVLAVPTGSERFDPETARQLLGAVIETEQPAVVLMAHSVGVLGYGAAVAAKLGLGFASDVTALRWDDGLVIERGAYTNEFVATFDFPMKTTTILQLGAGVEGPALTAGTTPVRVLDVRCDRPAVEHVAFIEPERGEVDIATADVLLSIGGGVDDQDEIKRFQVLAQHMGAVLSSSRPLVAAGWMSTKLLVGQSGKSVRPKVYLALGISGAAQHLAGIRGADTVIAVNTDAEAPIFGVADYGAIADLFDVASELEKHYASSDAGGAR